MIDREQPGAPLAVAVEFRSPSSFLIAYSLNLSRGGIFVETQHPLEPGTPLDVAFRVPGAGEVTLAGVVAWQREPSSPDGPPGVGVEFTDITAQLGEFIDHLVAGFHGIQILILATDGKDRTSLTRMVKSIVTSAELLQANDALVAETLITDEVDLAVIDVDGDPEGAIATVRRARTLATPVPVIALASTKRLRDHARAAGADELAGNPPAFEELQIAVMRALARPTAVR